MFRSSIKEPKRLQSKGSYLKIIWTWRLQPCTRTFVSHYKCVNMDMGLKAPISVYNIYAICGKNQQIKVIKKT